ncbi:MAG: exosortase/archaeosortase family protein [Planctomycetes bacterium]|nr:exosortase/archaeosortase family protein [Planctomycetota bacterium]
MTTAPALAHDARDSNVVELSSRTALVAGIALLVLFVAVFWEWIVHQVTWASHEPSDWGHTLIIPFVSGYFVWAKRNEIMAQPWRPAWIGLPLTILGIAWYMICNLGPAALAHHNVRASGLGITLIGMGLLLLGWRAMKPVWFPLFYMLIFFQTVSERLLNMVTFRMQDISAQGAYLLLNLIGIETDLSGNLLTILKDGVPMQLNVAEACSGMRMLVAFLALGVAMAYVSLPKLWQQSLLVLMGIPISIFVNVLRVASLGILGMFNQNFMSGEFHHMIGLVWLIPAFFSYLAVLWILSKFLVEEDHTKAANHAR